MSKQSLNKRQRQNKSVSPSNDVEAAHLQRIETDEMIASKADLFFQNATLFALGTQMAQSGKDTYDSSRLDWEARPFASQVADEAAVMVEAQKRRDIVVDVGTLTMAEDGYVSRGGGTMAVSQLAMGQLCSKAGAKGGVGSYLGQNDAEIRTWNFNTWMQRAKAKGEITAVLRTMMEEKVTRDEEGNPTDETTTERGIYGVVSQGYKIMDANHVIPLFMKYVDAAGKGEFQMQGPRWKFSVTFHHGMASDSLRVGDIFRGKVWVEGMDDGSGAIKIGVAIERVRCKNCTTIMAVDIKGVRHTATEISEKLEAAMVRANKAIGGFVERWNDAAQDQIIEGLNEGVPAQYIFQKLVERKLVWMPGMKADELVTRLVRAWEKEPGYTRADIVNAITLAAHTETWKSAWAQDDLEAQAGELMYQYNYVHLAPPTQEDRSRFGQLDV